MTVSSSMKRLADEISWKVRGVFATEENRKVGFWARSLFQANEIRAREQAAHELTVSPALRVADDDGYRRLPADAMPDVSEICAAGRVIARDMLSSAPGSTNGKTFHRNKLAGPEHMPALMALALDRRMIAMASAYLGVLPVITDLDYFLSVPSPKPWKKSQLWHCDDDAPRQLKVFVYCDDVGDDDGPFELIAAKDAHDVRNAIRYRYAGRRYRVTDEEMDQHLPRDKQLAIKGDKQSAFVVDTARCFHKGSRIVAPDRHRMVAVVLYCMPNGAKLPLRLSNQPGPYADLAATRTDRIERAVLGLPLS